MSEHEKSVRVSTELLAQMGEWSRPVRIKIVGDENDVLEMVFSELPTRAVVFRDVAGLWRFRLIDKGNGEIVGQSEGYDHRADALEEAANIVGAEDVEGVDE